MNRMHMNRMHMTLGIVSVVAALSAGCASTSPDESRMKQHAASVEDISKQWKQGNDLVVVGYSGARRFWQDVVKAAPVFNVFRPIM